METSNVELSIVMPCLNEAKTVSACIRKATGFLEKTGIKGEVVIGDNGSTDGSQDLARSLGARVVNVKERGYGAACIGAIQGSNGKYVIMGDSDESYDFSDLMPFVDQLRSGFDLVMGNRFRGGIKPGAMPWKNRWIGNPALSGIGRLLFSNKIRDYHCGLRGFSKAGFDRMNLNMLGMEFASEMVLKSYLMGLPHTEVPTCLYPDGRGRPPHLRPWRDGWRHLRLMFLFSPRWLFLIPGLLMLLIGILVSARLWAGPIFFGPVGFDVHTLIYSAALISIGYQTVLFATFTRIYGINHGLLPRKPGYERIFKLFNLELGLILGLLLVVVGFGWFYQSFSVWKQSGFGALDTVQSLRPIILSGLCLTLGVQTIFSSFFLSVLGLRTRQTSVT